MATIQGIYVAIFGRPVDPAGLVHWNTETNNGADLSSMIGALSASDEFKALYDGKSNTEVITAIYQALFGRAPEQAGLDFFLAGLENGTLSIESIAISILDGAQGTDKTIVDNKITAADAFTAQLDTQAEIDAYVGTSAADVGRAYLTPITDDPATIPTTDGTDETILTLFNPDGGQAPAEGGAAGGGGVPAPTPLETFLQKWTPLDANHGDTVAGSPERKAVDLAFVNLGVEYALYLEEGGEAFTTEIVKDTGGRSQSLHDNLLGNINAGPATTRGLKAELDDLVSANPDIAKYLERTWFDGNLEANTGEAAKAYAFDVLNSVNRADIDADGFHAIWTPLDADYGQTVGGDLTTNTAFVHLGAAYAKYLDEGGSSAEFASIQVKGPLDAGDDGDGRYQTLHDNLLGNLPDSATNGRGLGPLAAELLGPDRADFLDRATYSGNQAHWQGSDHDSVRVFDYERGFERNDYIVSNSDGDIDPSAQNNGELFIGDGNTISDFNIVRHEGAGIELALKAKERKGSDYDVTDEDGLSVYYVPTGSREDNGDTYAIWSFDGSVIAGLNGSARGLSDYSVKLFIDVDPTTGVSYVGGEAGIDLPVGNPLIQFSQNYAFGYIRDLIDNDPSTEAIDPYEYGPGEFDIAIKAFDEGVEIASNNIRVIVDDLIA